MSHFWNYLKSAIFVIVFCWVVFVIDGVKINTDMIYSYGFMQLVPNSLNSYLINKLFLFLPFLLTTFVFKEI